MRPLTLAVALVLATVARPSCASQILLTNLTAISVNSGGTDIASVTSAARFIAPTTAWLTDVTIWSTEEPRNNQWNGTAEWAIFADAGNNLPAATPTDSGVGLNPARTFLAEGGPTDSLNRQYTFTLDQATLLTAGTAYWLSPRFPGALIGWAGATDGVSGPVVQRRLGDTEWIPLGDQIMAFELRGQPLVPTPEPASLLLLGTGLAGLVLSRITGRRRA